MIRDSLRREIARARGESVQKDPFCGRTTSVEKKKSVHMTASPLSTMKRTHAALDMLAVIEASIRAKESAKTEHYNIILGISFYVDNSYRFQLYPGREFVVSRNSGSQGSCLHRRYAGISVGVPLLYLPRNIDAKKCLDTKYKGRPGRPKHISTESQKRYWCNSRVCLSFVPLECLKTARVPPTCRRLPSRAHRSPPFFPAAAETKGASTE